MSYAVMQRELEPPTLEQLKHACGTVSGLTEMDAHQVGKNACGILLRGMEMEEATAFQSTLAAQGVGTDVVDEAGLPQLPPAKNVNHLECTPEALIIYDPLNRAFPLKWGDIMLVAAGKVALQEFNQIRTEVRVPRYHSMPGVGTYMTYDTEVDIKNREERHERFLLEIIIRGAGLRYSVNADKSPLLFNYLGNRKTDNLRQNFELLVQDIAGHAPSVAINRGAYYLRENAEQSFEYPGKTAFYAEIVWLLWQLGQAPPGEG